MSRLVDRLPADDHTNGWSALLPRRVARPALQGDRDFDWVVIGAGYAGIAAARRLAEQEPAASIALIEAGEVGENASGRNSGFAIDLPHAPATSAASTEQGLRAIRVGRFALDELDRLVRIHGIDCDWQKRGRYHSAVTDEITAKVLKTYASVVSPKFVELFPNIEVHHVPWRTRRGSDERKTQGPPGVDRDRA
jgi:glycine/D-amino acid oxidase-like deaminating enzyme